MPECQFRVSYCFWFQKILHGKYRQNWGKSFPPNIKDREVSRSPKTTWGGAPRGPHAMGARPGWGRAQLGCGAPGWPPTPILHLYILPDTKTLKRKTIFHEKFRRGRHRQSQIGGVLTFFPAPCRRGNHHRGLLHHHACLRSDA